MSKSTPDDLAVAFRSLGRRQREAVDAAEGAPVGDLTAELSRLIGAAATLVGSAPDAAAIADAIGARPGTEWDAKVLDGLRDIATDAGAVVRDIAGRGPTGAG